MSPKNAWMTFSLLLVLGDAVGMVVLVQLGYDALPVLLSGLAFLLLCFYVMYKRYNVEVVPESDIELFRDSDDLRILCMIYGLDQAGDDSALRRRLIAFSKANESNAFAWVAPRFVQSLGTALELPGSPQAEGASPNGLPLVGGRERSQSRLMAIDLCPICDARMPKKGKECGQCGADLEFYSALRESKVGKRLVSEKARAVRRKLRYDVPALEGKR